MRRKIVKVEDIKREGKVLVLTHGCFDLLHVGHIKYLWAAKKLGDILVVSVTSDRFVNKGPGRPIFTQELRMEQLAALEVVDYVILSDYPDAIEMLNKIKPDIYVKGDEYENLDDDITGKIKQEKDIVESYGGKLEFTHEITFSSTKLINNFMDPLPENVRSFLKTIPFSTDDIFKVLDSLASLKVLVVGEVIFDKYTFVEALNISSKHSVVCSRFLRNETHYGGILATARHMSRFSNNVDVVTVLNNNYHEEVKTTIPTVNFKFIDTHSRRTVIKERFLDEKGKQLFRVDNMHDDPYYECEHELIDTLRFEDYDLIVVNDFGHGMLTPSVVNHVMAESKKKFLALNVQTNSGNKGFNLVTKYGRADYLSIDLPEARLALSDRLGDIESMAYKLSIKIPSSIMSITHGKYGTNIFKGNNFLHVPVFSTDAIDSTGAGDAYFGVTSMLAYVDAPVSMIGLVGNAVGALAIRILGNKDAIDPILLRKYITTLTKH